MEYEVRKIDMHRTTRKNKTGAHVTKEKWVVSLEAEDETIMVLSYDEEPAFSIGDTVDLTPGSSQSKLEDTTKEE